MCTASPIYMNTYLYTPYKMQSNEDVQSSRNNATSATAFSGQEEEDEYLKALVFCIEDWTHQGEVAQWLAWLVQTIRGSRFIHFNGSSTTDYMCITWAVGK